MEYRELKERDYTYNKQIGDTLYTIVVKSSQTAKKNIFDITKQILENDVEDMISEKTNELAVCSYKEKKKL